MKIQVTQAMAARAGRAPLLTGWLGHLSNRRGGNWAELLDFRPARPQPAPWAWALLAAGVLSMLWLADQADHLQQRELDAQDQFKRLARADRQLRAERAAHQPPGRAQAPQAAASAPALDPAAADEAVAMVRVLAFPWPSLLQRMELSAANAGAVMMSISTSLEDVGKSAGPTWRLQAAVRDDASALGWAASLPAGRLVSRASLATPFATSLGPYALNAEVQAQTRWMDLADLAEVAR